MEKQWNKIKECPLADGLQCMSNRAKEIVMNKSYCTLSGQKELIIHNLISMKHSDSVYFCLIYTLYANRICVAPYYLQPFSLCHISCNYLINGMIFGKLYWITINLRASSCAVPVIFSGFN